MTPGRCQFCTGVLELLEAAVVQGFHFTPAERAAMVARAQESIEETTPILLARIAAGVRGAKYTGWEQDMMRQPMATETVQ
jgi:hypothetical protein